jgi:inosose dehydratase
MAGRPKPSFSISRRRFVGAMPVWVTLMAGRRLGAATAPTRSRAGCQANGFPLRPPDFPGLIAALGRMREFGYAGFECNIRFVEGEHPRLNEARKRIADSGMEFIGAHMSMTIAKPDVFPRWVETVKALGGTCIVMSGPGLGAEGVFAREALLEKAASLNAFARTCREAGLRLAYHNHRPEFANHHAEIDGLASETDRTLVDFLIDAGHAHLVGGDPAAFMRKHADRIFGWHLSTYGGTPRRQVPLGKGDWGFEDIAAIIKSTGWNGWLISEEGGTSMPPNTAALGPNREYIRRIFGV